MFLSRIHNNNSVFVCFMMGLVSSIFLRIYKFLPAVVAGKVKELH